jgi:NAD(P)-dependent dehydrogenase (short-subunit alcohol dehydrogenase family)
LSDGTGTEEKVALVCGGAGGIGGVLLDHLLADSDIGTVYATHRSAKVSNHPKLRWITLDFADQQSIDQAITMLSAEVGALGIFVCATGFLSNERLRPEKSLKELQMQHMNYSLQVNAAGPLALLAGLEPALKASANPKVMFLSAQVGSIEDNHLGGWYSYRMSKAALNMGVKTAAIEAGRWRNGAALVSVHPGTTHTDLSQPFTQRRKQKVSTAKETGKTLYALLQTLGPQHNGKFLDRSGVQLPW